MKAYLQQWAERIDSLELRERALLLVAAVVVLYLLVDTLGLQPTLKSQQAVKQAISDLELKLSTQRQQFKLLTDNPNADPLEAQRRRRDQLEQELAELDRDITDQLGALVEPAQAAEVLEQVLSRQPGLSLVSLRASSEPLTILNEDDDEVSSGLGRYRLDLRVQGGYLSTLRYLQALEAMPWKFFWQKVDLSVEDYPRAQTLLKLYTVGARDD